MLYRSPAVLSCGIITVLMPSLWRKVILALITIVFLSPELSLFLFTTSGRLVTVSNLQRFERLLGKHIEPIESWLFKQLLPVRVEIQPGVSLLLDPRDYIPRTILQEGEWQPEVWRAISSGLSTGSVFLDVGAHIGYDTLKASVRVGKAGLVVAFEPNPPTLTLLRDNIAASHATNVIVEPIACVAEERVLVLYDSTQQGNSAAASLSRSNAD